MEIVRQISSEKLESADPNRRLHLCVGITPKQIAQLVKWTNEDPLVLELTSDDKRFSTTENFEKWFITGDRRLLFTLIDEQENLFGLGWVGRKQIPDNYDLANNFEKSNYPATAALRLYGEMRSMGLATGINQTMLAYYAEHELKKGSPPQKPYGIWAEIRVENVASINMSLKTGYQQVAINREGTEVLMVI